MKNSREICIQPVGEVENELLAYLKSGLERVFLYPCRIAKPIAISEASYNPRRGQYNAVALLKEMVKSMPKRRGKLLGVSEVDLFVPDMNFVFGVAMGNTAIISLYRLRNGHDVLRQRALKEAVHELGHTFGLGHCPDIKCVMHFSNSIVDTDIKDTDFCMNCSIIISKHV